MHEFKKCMIVIHHVVLFFAKDLSLCYIPKNNQKKIDKLLDE